MKEIFSRDTILSLREVVSLKSQTRRSKNALLAIPQFVRAIEAVLSAAPYLIVIYAFTGIIDLQQRVLAAPGGSIVFSSMVSLGIVIFANSLVYVETYNTHTQDERIQSPMWHAAKRIPRLIGTVTLSSLIIILGVTMFVIPGVYFGLRLSLAPPAAVLSDTSFRKSIYKSLDATEGQLTLIYTVFGGLGIAILPLAIGVAVSTGWAQLLFIFLLLGIMPVFAQLSLAVLYMNGIENGIESVSYPRVNS